MFKCGKCGAQTGPGQSCTVVHTYRKKTYRNRTRDEHKKVTRGFEPESEMKVCMACAETPAKEEAAHTEEPAHTSQVVKVFGTDGAEALRGLR